LTTVTPRSPEDITIEFDVRIPLRDSVELSANVYQPAGRAAPLPAIVALTPYTAQFLHNYAAYFAAHGYTFLAIDVRGRGNSGGVFDPMINEGRDGFDVVEWIARQPFCDGQVAMWGGSYHGYAQWMTAAKKPPHLKTIAPVAAPYASVDVPFRNNIPKPYFMQWLMYVSGKTGQDTIFADLPYWRGRFRRWFESGTSFLEIDRFLGLPSSVFQRWMSHPYQDEWWDAYNPGPGQYAALDIPILTITGMCDADQPGALMHYRKHMAHGSTAARANHYLVMGPWDHPGTRDPRLSFLGLTAGPASLLDLKALHLKWYDWVMRGGPRPEFLKSNAVYYVLGADEWRYAPELDAATGTVRTLYLSSGGDADDPFHAGTLDSSPSPSPPALAAADRYVHDPRDVSLTHIECQVDSESRTDQRMFHASAGRQLVYYSAPFPKETDISGFFRLTLWLAIDQPDTDIRAWIYEVAIDGSATLLTFDSMRARYREGLRTPKLIETSGPRRYDFERFLFVSKRIAAGSRLRLVVGPIHSIYAQKNYNSGKTVAEETIADARTVTVTLIHDAEHPSALEVPLDQKERPHV
jgi:putative CocE/NonD family hydrolase